MAYNSQKVEKMVREKGILAKDFFFAVYPDRSGNSSYKRITTNTNPKADTLERIANLLQCSIDELFDRDSGYIINNKGNSIVGDNNSVGNVQINTDPDVLMETIRNLRDVISRQDKTIDTLNHRIDQLIDLAKQQD